MRLPPESVVRIVETSRGSVRLEFSRLGRFFGGVTVNAFDADGWEAYGGFCKIEQSEKGLAALVQTVVGLPEYEAREVAERFLQDAPQRYAREGRKGKHVVPTGEFVGVLVGTFLPSALVGAAVALVLLILL